MNSFAPIPSSPDCAARHCVVTFGKYKGRMLGQLPGVYIKWLLSRPTLDPELRQKLFETLQESADRRYVLDQAVAAEVEKMI